MKFSYKHLPEQVQNDLKYIADFLVSYSIAHNKDPYRRYTPSCIRHIILHGCFTEDNWALDTPLRPDEVSFSYNLMLVISAHLWDILPILEEAVKKINQSGKTLFPLVTKIIDTKGRIDQKLRNGYLAYEQIQAKGILVYSKGDITLDLFTPLERPKAEVHYVQARDYYDHALPLAQLFMSGASSFQDKDRGAAAFMLCLAAGQAYEALMAVHILKYPLGRPLNDLRELAESIHPELSMIWTGLQGEQIFQSLTTAFRDVRFSSEYRITDHDLNLMFGYVEDLHKLVHYICQIKFDALKAGSLAKPNKDWLEVVTLALKPPEDPLFDDDEETEVPQITTPNTSPIFRTAEQEVALKKLRSTIFDLEEPCYELEQLGSVLKAIAHGDDDAEQSGIFVMGRVVQERTLMIKDIFKQMLGLLKEIRLRDDAPAEEKSASNTHDHFKGPNLKRSQEGPGQIMI